MGITVCYIGGAVLYNYATSFVGFLDDNFSSSCNVHSSFLVRLGLGGLTSGSSSSMALR